MLLFFADGFTVCNAKLDFLLNLRHTKGRGKFDSSKVKWIQFIPGIVFVVEFCENKWIRLRSNALKLNSRQD